MMNCENDGQTIPDFIDILRSNEKHSRTKRQHNMIRLFAESRTESSEKRFELKDASKINIKMVRQYRYDEKTEKVQLKSIPCICENCLQGNFNLCKNYKQTIIESDIIDYNHPRQLRPNSKCEEPEEIEESQEFEDFSDINLSKEKYESYIDMRFINDFLKAEPQSQQPSPLNANEADTQFEEPEDFVGYTELSSPNADHITSSQEHKQVDFDDLGSIDDNDDSLNDENYIHQRLQCMSKHDCLEPRRFLNDKTCLEALLKLDGWLYGWTLNYFGYMLLKERNDKSCSIMKTEIASWLKLPVKTRPEWQFNLLGEAEAFQNANRIIIPWHKEGNHWILLQFDARRKIIESFDSLHELPLQSDMKRVKNFLRVSKQSFH